MIKKICDKCGKEDGVVTVKQYPSFLVDTNLYVHPRNNYNKDLCEVCIKVYESVLDEITHWYKDTLYDGTKSLCGFWEKSFNKFDSLSITVIN